MECGCYEKLRPKKMDTWVPHSLARWVLQYDYGLLPGVGQLWSVGPGGGSGFTLWGLWPDGDFSPGCGRRMKRRGGSAKYAVPSISSSNQIFQILAAVDDSAHLHGVANHHIENRKVFHLNAIVRMLSLPIRVIRLKCLGAVQVRLNGFFPLHLPDFQQQLNSSDGRWCSPQFSSSYPQTVKDAQLIVLSVHGYVPLFG